MHYDRSLRLGTQAHRRGSQSLREKQKTFGLSVAKGNSKSRRTAIESVETIESDENRFTTLPTVPTLSTANAYGIN